MRCRDPGVIVSLGQRCRQRPHGRLTSPHTHIAAPLPISSASWAEQPLPAAPISLFHQPSSSHIPLLQVSIAVTRGCINIIDVHSETLVPGQEAAFQFTVQARAQRVGGGKGREGGGGKRGRRAPSGRAAASRCTQNIHTVRPKYPRAERTHLLEGSAGCEGGVQGGTGKREVDPHPSSSDCLLAPNPAPESCTRPETCAYSR